MFDSNTVYDIKLKLRKMYRYVSRAIMFFYHTVISRRLPTVRTDGSGVFGLWIFVLGTSARKQKYRAANCVRRSVDPTGIRRVKTGIIPIKIRCTIRAYPL